MDSVIVETWLMHTFFLFLAESLLISMCDNKLEQTALIQTFICCGPIFWSKHSDSAACNRPTELWQWLLAGTYLRSSNGHLVNSYVVTTMAVISSWLHNHARYNHFYNEMAIGMMSWYCR